MAENHEKSAEEQNWRGRAEKPENDNSGNGEPKKRPAGIFRAGSLRRGQLNKAERFGERRWESNRLDFMLLGSGIVVRCTLELDDTAASDSIRDGTGVNSSLANKTIRAVDGIGGSARFRTSDNERPVVVGLISHRMRRREFRGATVCGATEWNRRL